MKQGIDIKWLSINFLALGGAGFLEVVIEIWIGCPKISLRMLC